MARHALGIQYRGTQYCGWQKQSHASSVQQTLEQALSKVADHPIETVCAGRTDAGVHAVGQVVHFDSEAVRPNKAWVQGVNSALPSSIRVAWAKQVDEAFSARFTAQSRRYQYLLYRQPVASAFVSDMVTHFSYPLDISAMQQAADLLIGEQNFGAFQSAYCQSKTAMRCVKFVNLVEKPNYLIIDICANAFLHHMVRNIVGTLLLVGQHKCAVSEFKEIFQSQDRTLAGPTAPANGLYLVAVQYPPAYDLPQFYAAAIGALFHELD